MKQIMLAICVIALSITLDWPLNLIQCIAGCSLFALGLYKISKYKDDL